MRRVAFFVVLGALLLGVGLYLYLRPQPFGNPIPQGSLSTSADQTVPAHWKKYDNAKYLFSLSYPEDLTIKEYDEGNDSRTIVFANPAGDYTFQVFVTPYAENEVTPERFRIDSPSGVFKEPLNVVVGGAKATAFFGYNGVMGDTREVWIIENGFLYEITTYKELDDWLAKIINTMRFHT